MYSPILSTKACMLHLKFVNHSPTSASSSAHAPTYHFPQNQARPPQLNPTTSNTLELLALPPQTVQPRANGHHRPSPPSTIPISGENTIYVIMQASSQQIGVMYDILHLIPLPLTCERSFWSILVRLKDETSSFQWLWENIASQHAVIVETLTLCSYQSLWTSTGIRILYTFVLANAGNAKVLFRSHS